MTLAAVAAFCQPNVVSAHGATAGSKPLVPGRLALFHWKPGELVALFGREGYHDPQAGNLRAARAGNAETLLPAGVDALLRAENGEVILVGSEGEMQTLADCISVVDVPRERAAAGREKLVITLHHADPHRLRAALLRLPREGTATFSGRRLGLEGSPAWIHAALRQVIRAELKLSGSTSQTDP